MKASGGSEAATMLTLSLASYTIPSHDLDVTVLRIWAKPMRL
jgi:hypothetical protein